MIHGEDIVEVVKLQLALFKNLTEETSRSYSENLGVCPDCLLICATEIESIFFDAGTQMDAFRRGFTIGLILGRENPA
jgi:hypothetical protein